MELKCILFGILALFTICEARLLRPTLASPSRRFWRRKASLSISVPKGQRARSNGHPNNNNNNNNNNKLTHSLSLNNLKLAPGQSKVITQTLVVRRRPSGANKNPSPGNKAGSRRNGSGRRGLHAFPISSRYRSAPSQRGAHPTDIPARATGSPNGMLLLSKIQPHAQVSGHRNGMATIHLPVIDLGGASGTSSSFSRNSGNSQGHHPSTGHASANNMFGAAHGGLGMGRGSVHISNVGNRRFSVNELLNAGISQADIARALLAGNPDVVVIQDPVSTPASSSSAGGHNTNIISASLLASGNNNQQPVAYLAHGSGLSLNSLNSKSQTNKVVSKKQTLPPMTTMEPGEDPPELK